MLGYAFSDPRVYSLSLYSDRNKLIGVSLMFVLITNSCSMNDGKAVISLLSTDTFSSRESNFYSSIAEKRNGWSETFCWICSCRSI